LQSFEVEQSKGHDARQREPRSHVVVDAHHVGAQADIERRLVGNRAGPIEGAEVGIRHLVSSLQGASLPSPIRLTIWSLRACESIGLTLCNVAIYFHRQ